MKSLLSSSSSSSSSSLLNIVILLYSASSIITTTTTTTTLFVQAWQLPTTTTTRPKFTNTVRRTSKLKLSSSRSRSSNRLSMSQRQAAALHETAETIVALESVDATFEAIIDGAEWQSIIAPPAVENHHDDDSNYVVPAAAAARLSICTGISEQGDRVVALLQSSNNNNSNDNKNNKHTMVYQESVARIPPHVSDVQAARTLWHAWAAVHAVLPVDARGIGGDPDATFAATTTNNANDWKVVVLGSNEHALTAARALQALGCQVQLVTTNNNSKHKSNVQKNGLPPVMQAKTEDFSVAVGTFDAVLDTVGSELEEGRGGSSSFAVPSKTSVTALLQSRHKCHVYVSTRTHQQDILARQGLLFGPGKAKEYRQSLSDKNQERSVQQSPPPPAQLGQTVEKILQAGIVWPDLSSSTLKPGSAGPMVRGWTMGDYWESTTWPRSAAQPNVRFGFPIMEDDDDDDDEENDNDDTDMVRNGSAAVREGVLADYFQQQERISEESKSSPNVMFVTGVRGVEELIVAAELDCVLFLSAPFCRTCRYLKPQYQRMARLHQDTDTENDTANPVVFAKADATGEIGKELGRHLGVDSVPTFVLFQKGERYGTPMSISRLPSPELDRALAHLQQGRKWDRSAIFGGDNKNHDNKGPPRSKIF